MKLVAISIVCLQFAYAGGYAAELYHGTGGYGGHVSSYRRQPEPEQEQPGYHGGLSDSPPRAEIFEPQEQSEQPESHHRRSPAMDFEHDTEFQRLQRLPLADSEGLLPDTDLTKFKDEDLWGDESFEGYDDQIFPDDDEIDMVPLTEFVRNRDPNSSTASKVPSVRRNGEDFEQWRDVQGANRLLRQNSEEMLAEAAAEAEKAQFEAEKECIKNQVPKFIRDSYGNDFQVFYDPKKDYVATPCESGYRLNSQGQCQKSTPEEVARIGNGAYKRWYQENRMNLREDEYERLSKVVVKGKDVVALKSDTSEVLVTRRGFNQWLQISTDVARRLTTRDNVKLVLQASGTLVLITFGIVIVLGVGVLMPLAAPVTTPVAAVMGCAACVSLTTCCGFAFKTIRGACIDAQEEQVTKGKTLVQD